MSLGILCYFFLQAFTQKYMNSTIDGHWPPVDTSNGLPLAYLGPCPAPTTQKILPPNRIVLETPTLKIWPPASAPKFWPPPSGLRPKVFHDLGP